MSNRSAKLLLEVAAAIEQQAVRQPLVKLAGLREVALHPSLTSEVITWARGYRDHLKECKRTDRVKPLRYITVADKEGFLLTSIDLSNNTYIDSDEVKVYFQREE